MKPTYLLNMLKHKVIYTWLIDLKINIYMEILM